MSTKMQQRLALMNLLCRICGQEDKNCIPVFGVNGKTQEILKKIRVCLPLNIEETDAKPKQICLTCLHKLDATWELFVLCKEGQRTIEKKLNTVSRLHDNEDIEMNSVTKRRLPVENLCGVCNVEVRENQLGIGCEGRCQKWHHCQCINMSRLEYSEMVDDATKTWICNRCKSSNNKQVQSARLDPIEEKIRLLTENKSVEFGETAVILLAPQTPPPPVVTKDTSPAVAPVIAPAADGMMGVQPLYMQPATATTVPTPASVDQEVYPQSLIQVPSDPASKPVMYQADRNERQRPVPAPRRSVPAPKPMPPTTPRRNVPTPARRKALREGDSSVPPPKRSHQLCKYCNKSFPDDIIDHHVNLHLRQSFFTCIDCNKNFRSEMAMSRHRCGVSDTINLDPDDEPICL